MSTPYEEGRAAAANNVHFRDGCPYLFNRANVSQDEFNHRFRPLMDEWFRGWKEWLDENDLGFNFNHKKNR